LNLLLTARLVLCGLPPEDFAAPQEEDTVFPILQVRKVRLSKVKQAKITQPVNEFKPEQYDCQAPALKHYTSHYLSSHYLS